MHAVIHASIEEDGSPSDELGCGCSLLQGQYRIERPLQAGGFGVTYLARDSLDRQVVIKECFPAQICGRAGAGVVPVSDRHAGAYRDVLLSFLREAKWLARSQHGNIAGVHQVFRENNTAYIAMEFIDGPDLFSVFEDAGAPLETAQVLPLLRQALEALGHIHGLGILHRDIAPDNFLVDRDGQLKLIDFGAACGFDKAAEVSPAPVLSVKDGYSAHELYDADMPQRPSSDLYSLGATFYHLITGAPPPESHLRLRAVTAGEADPCRPLAGQDLGLDPALLAAIDKALEVLPSARFQSAAAWTAALDACGQEAPAPHAEPDAELADVEDASPGPGAAEPDACAEPGPQDEQDAIGAALDEAILSLVERTNSGLTQGVPRSEREAQTGAEAPEKAEKTLVDIFGEPIRDVDAWLDEQDRRQAKAASKKKTKADSHADAAGHAGRQGTSTIGRVLRHVLGRGGPRPGGSKAARKQEKQR